MNSTNSQKIPSRLNVFPLRDTVIFPGVPAQLSAERTHTVEMVTQAYEGKKTLAFVTTKNLAETPKAEDLYTVGTAGTIHRMWHLPDGSIRLLVHGICRIAISKIIASTPHLRVQTSPIKPSE